MNRAVNILSKAAIDLQFLARRHAGRWPDLAREVREIGEALRRCVEAGTAGDHPECRYRLAEQRLRALASDSWTPMQHHVRLIAERLDQKLRSSR